MYFVSGQRQFAAGQRHLLLQRGLHGRQRRRLLRLPRRRLQGHLRCRARVLMFLARDQVPSPCSRAPMSRDIITHLGAGCARVALYASRYSRTSYVLMQGLHTCACSPSMDVCNAGMDISPCVLVLKIITHQAPLYVNTCKQVAAPALPVRRASTRQRREVLPVTIARPASTSQRPVSTSSATIVPRGNITEQESIFSVSFVRLASTPRRLELVQSLTVWPARLDGHQLLAVTRRATALSSAPRAGRGKLDRAKNVPLARSKMRWVRLPARHALPTRTALRLPSRPVTAMPVTPDPMERAPRVWRESTRR